MTKVFLRTFFVIFLWVILIVNLFLFANFSNNFVNVNTDLDLQNKYFGFTSFIEAFKYASDSPYKDTLESSQTLYKDIYSFALRQFQNGFPTFYEELSELKVWEILLGIKVIWIALKSIFYTLGGLFVAVVGSCVMMFYGVVWFFSFFYFVGAMFSTKFIKDIPHGHYVALQVFCKNSLYSVGV